MTNNFDLRKFLSENRITKASQNLDEARYSDSYNSPASKEVGSQLTSIVDIFRKTADEELQELDAAIAAAEEKTGTEVTPVEKKMLRSQLRWIRMRDAEMERESVETGEEVIDEEVSEEIQEEKVAAAMWKNVKEASTNESTIYSDALDAEIKTGDILKLKNGTEVRVGAIPTKDNPKYGKGLIIATDLSQDGKGNLTIDINKDVVKEGVELSAREQEIVRLVENALGIPSSLPVTEAPAVEDEMVEENPLPKYKNIDELMKNIEYGTNEAAHKYKMNRMKEIADALEAKVTSLEEGDNAEHIDQKAVKAMKKDIMTLRKGVEKLEKEYEKKFAKKEKKEDK